MNSEERDALRRIFAQCSESLKRGEEVIGKRQWLRVVQEELRNNFLNSSNKRLRAFTYILSALIDKYYGHFAGAVPTQVSEKIAEVRKNFLKTRAAKSFEIFGRGDFLDEIIMVSGIEEFVDGYWEGLEKLREIGENIE